MAMSSRVLPQALQMIPWNSTQSSLSSKQLGFSASLYRGPVINRRLSVSRMSVDSTGFNCGFSLGSKAKRNLVMRAESNPESEAEASESSVEETVAEAVEEAEAEGEEAEAKGEEEEKKAPRKLRVKLGDVMGILNKRAIEASEKVRPVPDIRTGDIVEIKLEVPENRRRLSVYKGIVISKQNAGIHTTIRIRRVLAGVGVETVFPVYSPNIKEIVVVSRRKVRRARLYYLRGKLPRLSTFK